MISHARQQVHLFRIEIDALIDAHCLIALLAMCNYIHIHVCTCTYTRIHLCVHLRVQYALMCMLACVSLRGSMYSYIYIHS